MAEDMDVAQPTDTPVLDRPPMRDEDGEIHREFIEQVARAIHAADAPLLRAIVAELHEADLGDLIAALEPDDRVKLVELAGTDFDFSALNEVDDTVREEILDELEPETVASKASTKQTRSRSSKSCRHPSASRSSAACFIRKIPPAAGCRPSSLRCRRTGPWGKRSTTCATRPICRSGFTKSTRSTKRNTGRARCRWTRYCARAGRCRWPI